MKTKSYRDMARDLSEGLRESVIYTFVAGILAHGVMMFNKLSWFSDLNRGFINEWIESVSLGRWLKAFLNYAVSKAFGGKNLSLPLFFCAVSFLLIALSAHIIIRMFNIRRKSLRMVLCQLMVVTPVVTSTFGFMYDAPYYFLGLFLATAGVYIAANRPRWDGAVVGALCLCGSLGLYQAYFPVGVSLFVILLIMEIARERHASFTKVILRGLYFLGMCVAGLVLYYAIWKLAMKALGIVADDYQGVSSIGQSGIGAYIDAAKTCYERFLLQFASNKENLYPMKLVWVQWLIVAASGVSGLCLVLRHFRRDKWQAVLMAVLLAVLPICFNLIYMMGASSSSESFNVYSLMLYGQCMLYVFLIASVDLLWDGDRKLPSRLCPAAVAVLALMVGMNAYFDNSCYLKAEMVQQQTISNMTVLVSRIKSMEGYNDLMPVCILRTGEKDATLAKNEAFKDIRLRPYTYIYPSHSQNRFIVDYLEKWCGFAPKYAKRDDFMDLEEVQQMPDYPDDGSIKIINGTVVVKW